MLYMFEEETEEFLLSTVTSFEHCYILTAVGRR